MDGLDLSSLLSEIGGVERWPERYLFMQLDRMSDVPRRYQNYAVIGQQFKLVRPSVDAKDELYDLLSDPGEREDLASSQPDRVERMRAAYDKWFDDVASERNFVPPRAVLGAPEQNPCVLTRQDWRGPERVHMSDSELGYWDVTISRDGKYTFEVLSPRVMETGRLFVKSGGLSMVRELSSRDRCYRIADVTLVQGDARLEAWVEEGDVKRGVTEVRVSMESSDPVGIAT